MFGLHLGLNRLATVSGDTTPGGSDSALLLCDGTSGLLLCDGSSFLLLAS
jgi:hypothetical protein